MGCRCGLGTRGGHAFSILDWVAQRDELWFPLLRTNVAWRAQGVRDATPCARHTDYCGTEGSPWRRYLRLSLDWRVW